MYFYKNVIVLAWVGFLARDTTSRDSWKAYLKYTQGTSIVVVISKLDLSHI